MCGAISKGAKLGSDELRWMAIGLKEVIRAYTKSACLPQQRSGTDHRNLRPRASEPKAAGNNHDRDPALLICWTCGSLRRASMDTCIDGYSKDGLHPLQSEQARGPALVGAQPDIPATRDNMQRLVTRVELPVPAR